MSKTQLATRAAASYISPMTGRIAGRGWHEETRGGMSMLDDRERAFEARFAHDQEMQFKAEARRNRLLGLWAAGKMGLSPADAEAYVRAVIVADFEEPGERDVFRKVYRDLQSRGVDVSEAELRRHMDEFMLQAKESFAREQDWPKPKG